MIIRSPVLPMHVSYTKDNKEEFLTRVGNTDEGQESVWYLTSSRDLESSTVIAAALEQATLGDGIAVTAIVEGRAKPEGSRRLVRIWKVQVTGSNATAVSQHMERTVTSPGTLYSQTRRARVSPTDLVAHDAAITEFKKQRAESFPAIPFVDLDQRMGSDAHFFEVSKIHEAETLDHWPAPNTKPVPWYTIPDADKHFRLVVGSSELNPVYSMALMDEVRRKRKDAEAARSHAELSEATIKAQFERRATEALENESSSSDKHAAVVAQVQREAEETTRVQASRTTDPPTRNSLTAQPPAVDVNPRPHGNPAPRTGRRPRHRGDHRLDAGDQRRGRGDRSQAADAQHSPRLAGHHRCHHIRDASPGDHPRSCGGEKEADQGRPRK